MVQFATSESHIKKFMLLSCNDQKRWFDHFWNLVMFLKMSTNFQKTTFFSVTNLKKNTYMFHSNMILENVDWFPPEILNRRMFWRGIQRELTQHLKVAGTDGSSNNKNSGNGWRCVCVCVCFCFKKETHKTTTCLTILYHTIFCTTLSKCSRWCFFFKSLLNTFGINSLVFWTRFGVDNPLVGLVFLLGEKAPFKSIKGKKRVGHTILCAR